MKCQTTSALSFLVVPSFLPSTCGNGADVGTTSKPGSRPECQNRRGFRLVVYARENAGSGHDVFGNRPFARKRICGGRSIPSLTIQSTGSCVAPSGWALFERSPVGESGTVSTRLGGRGSRKGMDFGRTDAAGCATLSRPTALVEQQEVAD